MARGTGATQQPVICTHDDAELPNDLWRVATTDLPAMNPPLHCRWQDLPLTATAKVKRLQLQQLLADGAVPAIAFNTATTSS